MWYRRWILPITVLAFAACSDGTAPLAPRPEAQAQGPHFLRWASTTAPLFEATGALAEGDGLVPGLALAGTSLAPVAVERATSASGSASSLTWSHAVGTGANRYLLVGVSIRNSNNPVRGVTYAGRALTLVGAQDNGDRAVRAELWALVAPPSGTGSVVVKLSGGGKMVAGAVSFTGVDPVDPFGAFVSAASPGNENATNPAVALDSAVSTGMAFSVVATEGFNGTLTPTSGQTSRWSRFYGTSGGDVAGGASTASAAATVTMGWTKTANAKWAMAAVRLHQAPNRPAKVATYTARFWAVRGQTRSIRINYAAGGGTSPFMTFTASDPTYVPGRGDLAVGDSVLITATVDSQMVGVSFEPSGLQFGVPSSLKIWYGGAGGDLNGDGKVDAKDAYIESELLAMWCQSFPTDPWVQIPATQSLVEKSFTTDVPHFSKYAVSW